MIIRKRYEIKGMADRLLKFLDDRYPQVRRIRSTRDELIYTRDKPAILIGRCKWLLAHLPASLVDSAFTYAEVRGFLRATMQATTDEILEVETAIGD